MTTVSDKAASTAVAGTSQRSPGPGPNEQGPPLRQAPGPASLRRRTQWLFAPFVALLFCNLALDQYFLHQRDEVAKVVDGRLTPARAALAEMLTGLVDQETGGRGFIITGQESFLGPYQGGQARVDGALEELERLLDHDDDLMAAVERVRSRVSAWRQLGVEFELEAKRAGRHEEAAALVATGTGTELFNRARQEIASLQGVVRGELQARQARLEDLRQRLTDVRVAGVLVGLVIVLVARWLLRRWITDPVDDIGASVRLVASGDLGRAIRPVGPPELSDLALDVEAMRERLLAEVDEASAAREALAQRGMVVLGLRDELAPGTLAVHDGITIAARFQPAEGVVAGDWFDVVVLGEKLFAVALVDVSGHGTNAGVFALKTKYLTLAALREGLSPARAWQWLACQLGDTGDDFLTGVIIEIDAPNGRLRYASAGHPPILVAEAGSVVALGHTGPLLGPLEGSWTDVEASLPPSRGMIALYSDGVIEAQDADGAELGIDGLAAVLTGDGALDPVSAADACMAELARVRGGRRQQDDITLVIIGRASSGSGADDDIGAGDDVGGHLDP